MDDDMEVCMHWGATSTPEGDRVRKTCPLCGASGTAARCAGQTLKKERCKSPGLHKGFCARHLTQRLAWIAEFKRTHDE